MSNYSNSGGIPPSREAIVRRRCLTGELIKCLPPFLDEEQQKRLTVSALNKARKKGETPEFKTVDGQWIARPTGKSGKFNLWDIAFRPNNFSTDLT